MFESSKVAPIKNEYQYMCIFIAAVLIDVIVRILSMMKYNALKARTNGYGIAPELTPYYRSLGRKGPFGSPFEDTKATVNSLCLSALIAGCLGMILLFIADIMLYIAQNKLIKKDST